VKTLNAAAVRHVHAECMVRLQFIDLRDAPALDASHLSPDEQARYRAFRVPTAALRWLRARLALRGILGQATGRPPKALMFVTGSEGKPALADDSLEFSLSHSGDWACVAWSRAHRVGVDIEDIYRVRQLQHIASILLCEQEATQINMLAPGRRQDAMLRLWTRKEAIFKASGLGLQRRTALRALCALDEEIVAPADAEGSRLATWRVCDLDAPDGIVASLAWPHRLHFPSD
jgi:4'-phosphopantetheinyl transferase